MKTMTGLCALLVATMVGPVLPWPGPPGDAAQVADSAKAAVSPTSPLAPRPEPATSAQEWIWPLAPPPEVVRPFEPPASPWGPGHRGVDLTGRPDQLVRAAGGGVVTYAGLLAGRGVVVVAHRGALRTTYEPVRPQVSVGVPVRPGDVIGRLALANGHCLPQACLHWGLIRGSRYLDPLLLLRPAGSARLLPLPDDQAATAVRLGGGPGRQRQ